MTGTALDAFRLVDNMRYLLVADDGVGGTTARAKSTSDTLGGIDNITLKSFTLSGRTLFVYHVGNIFIPEVIHGGKHRVGRCLSKAAKGGIFDYLSKILEIV